MALFSFLRAAAGLSLGAALLAGCGGSGGGTAPKPTGSSLKTPLPGSVVGNWVIDGITVVKDTDGRLNVRDGMNIRVGPDQVEVLADIYLGKGAILAEVVGSFYGGELEVNHQVARDSFSVSVIVDYSAAFSLPVRHWYRHVTAQGKVSGTALRIQLLVRDFAPDATKQVVEIGRDEVVLACKPGGDVPDVAGDWLIQAVTVIYDTGRPHTLEPGQKLVTTADRVLSLFGSPFTVDAFVAEYPDFDLLTLLSNVGNGVVQGFISFRGKPPFEKTGATGEFNFYHTGQFLQGELRIIWGLPDGQDIDHVYLALGRPMSMAQLEPPPFTDWLLMPPAEFEHMRGDR